MNDNLIKIGIEFFLTGNNSNNYNFSNVKICVQQGIVLLAGKVLTGKEISYALSAVRSIPGVKKVICKLETETEIQSAKLPSLATVFGI